VALVSLGYQGHRAGQESLGLWEQQDCQGELEEMEGRWDSIPDMTYKLYVLKDAVVSLQGSKGLAGERGPKGATVRLSTHPTKVDGA